MNKIFITSDHHFYHKNIIKYCHRPFNTVDEMNQKMIERWNEVVGENDMVIHLGDVSAGIGQNGFNKLKSQIKQLNGQKSLIRGNHDYFTNEQYTRMGFGFVGDYLIREVNGKKFLFYHYPAIIDNYSKHVHKHAKHLMEEHQIDFLIHGHRHHKNPEGYDNFINVGVDLHNFYPQDFNEILKSLDI